MGGSQAVTEWSAGTWRLENEKTWSISAVPVRDGGGERSLKQRVSQRGHLRTNQMSPRGATPPEMRHQIYLVSWYPPFFILRLSEQDDHDLIVSNPIVNKPSITKENNMSLPPTHPLRGEGYCGICKRNFRDMGRHNLNLHDGRGIHAWGCLGYKTGHGGWCTFIDCIFAEMRMHYLKHHAEELESIQVKWKKGYYSVEDGHIVPCAPFYPSEHRFTAIDDPTFPAPRLEIDEEKYQQMEGAAAPLSPMVRPTSASGMYKMEAWRWEDEAPPRKRSRMPSPTSSLQRSHRREREGYRQREIMPQLSGRR